MIESILNIVEAALSIWNSKEKTKYADQLIEIKTRYYDELKKERASRNSAVLDDCLQRLRVISDSIAAAINPKNS